MQHLIHSDPNQVTQYEIESLISEFLHAHDIQQISRDGYKRRLRIFLGFLADHGIRSPSRDDIVAYKRWMVAEKYSALTINAYLVAVRSLMSWLEGTRGFPNPAKSVRGVKAPLGFRRDALPITSIPAFLTPSGGTSLREMRDQAMLRLLLMCGLRSIEVSRANVEDIRELPGGEIVLFVMGKGHSEKDQFVCLSPSVLREIREYLSARGTCQTGTPLFASTSSNYKNGRLSTRTIRGIAKARLRSIGHNSPRLSTHSLRHGFATASLICGTGLQETASAMRHASLSELHRYAQNLDRAKGVAESNLEAFIEGLSKKDAA